jgi:hypothetical protein
MRKVDLAIELQILSFYQLRRSAPSRPSRRRDGQTTGPGRDASDGAVEPRGAPDDDGLRESVG